MKPLAKKRIQRYPCTPGQRDRASLEHNRAITTIHESVEHPAAEFSPKSATENIQTENYARIECAVRHIMDTVFTPEQRTALTGDLVSSNLMSSATKPIKRPIVETGSAANADQLDEMMTATRIEAKGIETTGAWDAYDVWRRFIKEARDRRKHQD